MASAFKLPPIFPDSQLVRVPIPGTPGTIAVEDSGDLSDTSAPTMLFLHGIGDFRQTYLHLAPLFHKKGHCVLLADLRGCGDSTADFLSYSTVDVANDAVAILKHFKVEKPAVVVSNSMSASSSAYLAAKHPDLVAALVCTGPFLRDVPGTGWFGPVSHVLFFSLWGTAMWVTFWKTLFGKRPPDFEESVNDASVHLRRKGHLAALGQMVRTPKKPCWEVAGDVKCPVLLIFGSKDPDFKDPPAEAEVQRQQLKSAKKVNIEILEGVGHYPTTEEPQKVFEITTSFLESYVRAERTARISSPRRSPKLSADRFYQVIVREPSDRRINAPVPPAVGWYG